jgi:hypothetical protein
MSSFSDSLTAVECTLRVLENEASSVHISNDERKRLERIAITCSSIVASSVIGSESPKTAISERLNQNGNSDSFLISGFEKAEPNDNRIHSWADVRPSKTPSTSESKMSNTSIIGVQEENKPVEVQPASGLDTPKPEENKIHLSHGQNPDKRIHPDDDTTDGNISRWGLHRSKANASLSKEEMTAARNAFSALDTNTDGTLCPEELFSVLSCMGIVPSGNELHSLLKEFDVNGDGSIGFEEFIKMMVNIKARDSHRKTKRRRSPYRSQKESPEEPLIPLVDRLSSITELVQKVHKFNARRDVIGNSRVSVGG